MSTSDYSSLSRLSSVSVGEYPDKFELFVDNLKDKYDRLINSVRPVPLEQSWKSVEEIFVKNEIEYLDNNSKQWKPVESHFEVITNPAKRIVVEGGPGSGKSTLALKWVSEWCQSEESQLSQIDILLFLFMRDIPKKLSIYDATKLLLLPKESSLTDQDIKDILTSGRHSICFVIDGLDEALGKLKDCDIKSIMKGEMFPVSKVIITTRSASSSKIVTPQMLSVRLHGFDKIAQEGYMKKAIDSNTEIVRIVRKMCTENVASSELLKNPLVFAMLCHIISKNQDVLSDQHGATSYIESIVKGFHYHLQYKKDPQKSPEDIKEDKKMQEMIGKLAFDGLCSDQRCWKTAEISKSIGLSCFEKYFDIGILVEEIVTADTDSAKKLMSDTVLKTQQIKFLDNIIQDFYAACYLQHIIMKNKEGIAIKHMSGLIPHQFGNVFVYASGLLPGNSKVIINFLTKRRKYSATVKLCLSESSRMDPSFRASDFRDEIVTLLHNDTSILHSDSILMQRATVNLLAFSTALQIEVPSLILESCFKSVDDDKIILESGLKLPAFTSVIELKINYRGREFSEEEIEDILYFACTQCTNLKTLEFGWCLLPRLLRFGKFLEYFCKKHIEVLWFYGHGLHYRWNLRGRFWAKHLQGIKTNDGETLIERDYEELKKKFTDDQEKFNRRRKGLKEENTSKTGQQE